MNDGIRSVVIRKSERRFPIKGTAETVYRSLSTMQCYQFRDGGYHNVYFGGTYHPDRNPAVRIKQMLHAKSKNVCPACGMPLFMIKIGNIPYCSKCGAFVPA